ncbi:hypothetical protein ACFWJ4_15660 [Kitasatospora sp. NPDC127067]|uniref:hypothetical protein n=1 Tax=Kitasatospora sp. NPDC127067 TaxID=3347126 RepID=UPI00364E35F0
MGAGAWSYAVPHREDLQAALDALREKVFSEDEFYREEGLGSLAELMVSGRLDEQGAHSVLDVVTVVHCAVDEEDHGDVRVVEGAEVVELFGTGRPSLDIVRAAEEKGVGDIDFPPSFRGSGCCTVTYGPDGAPDGLYFWGVTGD